MSLASPGQPPGGPLQRDPSGAIPSLTCMREERGYPPNPIAERYLGTTWANPVRPLYPPNPVTTFFTVMSHVLPGFDDEPRTTCIAALRIHQIQPAHHGAGERMYKSRAALTSQLQPLDIPLTDDTFRQLLFVAIYAPVKVWPHRTPLGTTEYSVPLGFQSGFPCHAWNPRLYGAWILLC